MKIVASGSGAMAMWTPNPWLGTNDDNDIDHPTSLYNMGKAMGYITTLPHAGEHVISFSMPIPPVLSSGYPTRMNRAAGSIAMPPIRPAPGEVNDNGMFG